MPLGRPASRLASLIARQKRKAGAPARSSKHRFDQFEEGVMPVCVPIYERSNEFAPRSMSEAASSCPHAETCMSASRCKGSCWFSVGDFDLGEPEVTPQLVETLRRFAHKWREESGCTWREVARIFDAPVTTVFEVACGGRDPTNEVALDMASALRQFAVDRARRQRQGMGA